MSTWSELVSESKVIERLNELGPALDRCRAREDNTPVDIDGLERIRTVLTFVGKRIDGADGDLLRVEDLSALAAAIAAAVISVESFAGNGDESELAAAQVSVDSALSAFSKLVMPTKTTDLRGLREAAESYRNGMSEQIRVFDVDIDKLRSATDTHRSLLLSTRRGFEEAKATLDADVAAFKEQLSTAQNELIESHGAAKAQFDEEGTASFEKWGSDFQAAQAARKESFDTQLAEADESFATVTTGYDDQLKAHGEAFAAQLSASTEDQKAALTELHTDYEAQAKTAIATINDHLARVQELVGVIGDHGVTGGFKQAADSARTQVIVFQILAIGAMLALVAFTGYTAIHLQGGTFNALDLGRRLLFTVTVGALATYAASQVSRYQQVERKNRKLELELRALGPFLEPVAPEEREKFRLKIAEVFFGKDEPEHNRPGPATALHASKETVEKLLDIIKSYVEKK